MKTIAHPNIAFVKYWGFLDEEYFLPLNPSIGMTADGFYVVAEVEEAEEDRFFLNGEEIKGDKAGKPQKLMNFMRKTYGIKHYHVYTESNIPMGTGIASSAASMASIAAAVLWNEGMKVSTEELSRVARVGSGSAARSVPGHFAEWVYGETHERSYGRVVAEKDHWDLSIVTFIISKEHKKVSSWEGHKRANEYNIIRVKNAWKNWWNARTAILERDVGLLGRVIVDEMNGLMAAALTSGILYYEPDTIRVLREVYALDIPAFPTMDAGPTVHVFTLKKHVKEVKSIGEDLDIPVVLSYCGEGVRRKG